MYAKAAVITSLLVGIFNQVNGEVCDPDHTGSATLLGLEAPTYWSEEPVAFKGTDQTFVFEVTANGIPPSYPEGVGGKYSIWRVNENSEYELVTEGWDLEYNERIYVFNGQKKDLDITVNISGQEHEYLYVQYELYRVAPGPTFVPTCTYGEWVAFYGPIVEVLNIEATPHEETTGKVYEGLPTEITFDLVNYGGQMSNYWYALVMYDEYDNELMREYLSMSTLSAFEAYPDRSHTFEGGLPVGWMNPAFWSYHGDGEWVGSDWFYCYPVAVTYIYPGSGGYYLKEETVNDVIGCIKNTSNIVLEAVVHPDLDIVKDKLTWSGATQNTSIPERASFSRATPSKELVEVKYNGAVKREADIYTVWFELEKFNRVGPFVGPEECSIPIDNWLTAGLFNWATLDNTHNGENSWFTITPSDAYNIREYFTIDCTRWIIEAAHWRKTLQGSWFLLDSWDQETDDMKTGDEDNTLSEGNKRVYMCDYPGPNPSTSHAEAVLKANFLDYVQVTWDGAGSAERASDFSPWYTLHHTEQTGGAWNRKTGSGSFGNNISTGAISFNINSSSPN
jgi:hypothetical protein